MTTTLTQGDLDQFTGTEVWYRHGLVRGITYTEGAKYLADRAGAYWLLDEIACNQLDPRLKFEPFQVWKLKRHGEHGATLSVEDGNDNVVFSKEIEFTDFPMDEVILWFTDDVILLPSEY